MSKGTLFFITIIEKTEYHLCRKPPSAIVVCITAECELDFQEESVRVDLGLLFDGYTLFEWSFFHHQAYQFFKTLEPFKTYNFEWLQLRFQTGYELLKYV